MKILIIKMSSLGDLIHTLPAVTDMATYLENQKKDFQVDWIAEESFAEIPTWHSKINRTIPIALRRWGKNFKKDFSAVKQEWKNFKQELQTENYDVILDAQGLVKSAIVSLFAKLSKECKRVGLDFSSATESLASFCYQKKVHVDLQAQAVFRMRSIFAQSFDYDFNTMPFTYGLKIPEESGLRKPYVLFAHGTTWPSKRLSLKHWIAIAKFITDKGVNVYLPWGNTLEKDEAEAIAHENPRVSVLPKQNLTELSRLIAHAKAMVSIDTGLAHLAAAFNIPNVTIYGPTSPNRTGTVGNHQIHFQPAFDCLYCDKPLCRYSAKKHLMPQCLNSLKPEEIFKAIEIYLN